MIDSTTFYLAYFYPRVAVYDDYEGWNMMDFTDLQEFHSDFNNYDVAMESPMLVNDESYADSAIAHFVVGHEIARTYLPFYMGINETRYTFMDDGRAAAFEYLLNYRNMGEARATELYRQLRIEPWVHETSGVGDIPIATPSDATRNPIYRMNAYG